MKKQFIIKNVRDDGVTIEMNFETLELNKVVQNFENFLRACGFNIGTEVELIFAPTIKLQESSLQPLEKNKLISGGIIHPTLNPNIPIEGFTAR